MKNITKDQAKSFLKNGTWEEKKSLYTFARELYYNSGDTVMSDAEFDLLEDSLRSKFPNWAPLKETGAKIKLGKKTEIDLLVPCPSLDKIVAEKPKAAEAWLRSMVSKYSESLFISAKLDGCAIEAGYTKGKLDFLATRGDGKIGKNIMFLADHLNLPKKLEYAPERLVIRLEAIMPTKAYFARWAGKYDTARALASAVLNRQDAAPALKDLHFIALKILAPNYMHSVGLEYLERVGFKTVKGDTVNAKNVTIQKLVQAVAHFKSSYGYEVDGIVISPDLPNLKHTEDRPDYARAFKVNHQEDAVDTEVVSIQWNPSSFGVIVPKILIKPVRIGGAEVKQAAAFNAAWVIDRKIGPGAKIRVLRSGDIIPTVVEVVKPAPVKLPSSAKLGAYRWDSNRVNLVLDDADDNDSVAVRRLARFFAALQMDQVAAGLAKKLVAAGFRKTAQVIKMTEADFKKLPGVKSRAKTFAEEMRSALAGAPIQRLMVASGAFERGVGRTRLNKMLEVNPKLLSRDALQMSDLKARVASMEGCGPAFAALYVRGLPKFYKWMDATGAVAVFPSKKKGIKGPLSGMGFTWTGYRSADEERTVNSLGGEVVPFGSKTSVLFYSSSGKASTKVEKAQEKGIKTSSDFKKTIASLSK